MVKKVISFALIGVFSTTLLVACGQPSEKVEPTVTREAVEIPETTAATPAAPEGTTASSETGASGSGLTIDAVDIAWSTKTLSGPADQEFTITVTNKGQATHDFAIPDLNIETKMLAPGESATVTVNAPAGDYQYLCTVPGHAEAGMTGTLTLAAGTALPGGAAGAATSEGTGSTPETSGAQQAATTIDMVDIAFQPNEFTIAADQDVTVTLVNKGAAAHDFSVTDHKNPDVKNLDINVSVEPGETKTVTINAPAGDYYFYCSVPGHEAAGMFGTMHVVAGGGEEAAAAPPTESTPSSEATSSTETAPAASGGETNLTIDAVDIAWSTKTLTGPSDQDFTITVTNKGQATHDFAIPDLNIITEMLAPGQSATVTVNAPAGDYEYECTVPGHAAAGMVGTLTLAAGGGAAAPATESTPAATESTPAAATTESTPAVATESTPVAATESTPAPVIESTPATAVTESTPVAATESTPAIVASPAASPAASPVASPAASSNTLELSANDIYFDPKTLEGTANTDITISITNKGAAVHDFAIPDLNILTEMIQPGQTVTVTVNAPAGTYQYLCTVPGHAPAGMVGTLTLK